MVVGGYEDHRRMSWSLSSLPRRGSQQFGPRCVGGRPSASPHPHLRSRPLQRLRHQPHGRPPWLRRLPRTLPRLRHQHPSPSSPSPPAPGLSHSFLFRHRPAPQPPTQACTPAAESAPTSACLLTSYLGPRPALHLPTSAAQPSAQPIRTALALPTPERPSPSAAYASGAPLTRHSCYLGAPRPCTCHGPTA